MRSAIYKGCIIFENLQFRYFNPFDKANRAAQERGIDFLISMP
jgi:hypothetical protein